MPAEDHAKEAEGHAKEAEHRAKEAKDHVEEAAHRANEAEHRAKEAEDHAEEAEDHAKEAKDHADEGSLWATRESMAANSPGPKYCWSSSRVTGSSEHAQHTCCSSSCALLASTCTNSKLVLAPPAGTSRTLFLTKNPLLC